MKILDPQAAVLTNAEVLSFMRAHPPRKADPRVGGYPVTDLSGLWSVQKEFTDYAESITPHLLFYPDPPSRYMRTLLQRLNKFNLTKPEVLMMINLGVGVKKGEAEQDVAQTQKEAAIETVENGEGDLLDKVERHINSTEGHDGMQVDEGQTSGEDGQIQNVQEEDNGGTTVLNTVIEEMYDRFNDADINEILQICAEVLGDGGTGHDAMPMPDK